MRLSRQSGRVADQALERRDAVGVGRLPQDCKE